MTGFQNLHTHTTFCDGALSPEDVINAALKKGCRSIGFSEHSHVSFDKYSMTLEGTSEYVCEVNRLKGKYEGSIEIFLGIEQDYYSGKPPDGLDYILGTAHYIKSEKGDGHICIDNGANLQMLAAERHFGGDYYAMAEGYFDVMSDLINKTSADIVGHFDLIAKYNFGGRLFDETHPRYVGAALRSMEAILEYCKVFEVNTGAMYRFGNPEPYPSVLLLKELRKRGGEVILSSDSHDEDSLFFMFDEMKELLKSCGYRYLKRLTRTGFIDVKL